MNRRDVLQLVGLAPVAVLSTSEARAAEVTVNDKTFNALMREVYEERQSWNERKLFSVTGHIDETLTPEVLIPVVCAVGPKPHPEPPKSLGRIAQVVRAATKTPDITEWAKVRVWGTDGLWNEANCGMSAFYLDPAGVLAGVIIEAAREQVRKDVNDYGQKLVKAIENGAIHEKLKWLASVEASFFYYGPPPYPANKGIHYFNFEKDAWEPLRPHRVGPEPKPV